MCIEKTIQECINFLLESHIEMDDYGEGFLERKEISLMEILSKKNYKTWTNKMSCNGWKLLEKYKDLLNDYNIQFKDVEEPDLIDETTTNNILVIRNNKFEILNPNKEISSVFIKNKLDFNLNNIYKIYPLILENKVFIEKEYFKFINMFFNLLKESDMQSLFDIDKTKRIKKKLNPYQAIGVLFLLINKRAFLCDEMGLGKTLQVLSCIEIGNLYPALIVCRNGLKIHLFEETKNSIEDLKIEILNKKSTIGSDVYIINFESLHKYIDLIDSLNFKSIVIDEFHHLKNPKTRRTKSCFSIIKNIPFRYGLTGTPFLKEPSDLIAPLKLLNKFDEFGNEADFFEQYYMTQNNVWNKTTISGTKNLSDLNRRLKEIGLLKRRKEDVAYFMPSKSREILYLEQKGSGYKNYFNDYIKLPRQEQIANFAKLRQLALESKFEYLTEWIDEFLLTEKKLIVFAFYKKTQEKLIEKYPQAAKIIQEMSSEERQNDINRFQNDDDCKIIICSVSIASCGINLTASSDVLFAEFDWCAATLNQCEDRAHRIGQTQNVSIWISIAKNTIEEYMYQIVKEKEKIINKLENNENIDFSCYESSNLDLLLERIKCVKKAKKDQ